MGKGPETIVDAREQAQEQIAARDRGDFNKFFRPLEEAAIADLDRRQDATTSYLKGTVGADIAQQESSLRARDIETLRQSGGDINSGRNVAQMEDTATVMASARNKGVRDANFAGQEDADTAQMNVLNTLYDRGATENRKVQALSQIGSQNAIAEMENARTLRDAKISGLTSIGTGFAMNKLETGSFFDGALRKKKQFTIDPATSVNTHSNPQYQQIEATA